MKSQSSDYEIHLPPDFEDVDLLEAGRRLGALLAQECYDGLIEMWAMGKLTPKFVVDLEWLVAKQIHSVRVELQQQSDISPAGMAAFDEACGKEKTRILNNLIDLYKTRKIGLVDSRVVKSLLLREVGSDLAAKHPKP